MAKHKKEQVVYYHERSEKIFRDKAPKIAEIVNSMKPYLRKLGFLENTKFTDLATDLLNSKFGKIDEHINNEVSRQGGNIQYVENQIRKDLSEVKGRVIDLVNEINEKIKGVRSILGSGLYFMHTLDDDECLSPKFLSIDENQDIFVLDERAVDNVKKRFEISFSGEQLEFYKELENVSTLLNSISQRAEKMGFDPFYFNPLELIESEDNKNSFNVNVLTVWEMFRMRGLL